MISFSLFCTHFHCCFHLFVHSLSRRASSCTCINNYKGSNKDEIEYEHSNSSIETFDVASTYAFAEKDAMVIMVINTDTTVITVIHVSCHFWITLVAIIVSHVPPCFLVISHEFLWPVALHRLVGCLELLPLLISQSGCSIRVYCPLLVLFLCFWTLLLVAAGQISILLIPHLTVVKIRLWLNARVAENASE